MDAAHPRRHQLLRGAALHIERRNPRARPRASTGGPHPQPRPTGWRRITGSLAFRIVFGVVVMLVVVNFTLPFWLRDYVNRVLSEAPDYDGSVREVRVNLLRGAYTLIDTRIVRTTGKVPVPFLADPKIDLSVRWGALIHGAFVGEVTFFRPQLNFVGSSDAGGGQTGAGQGWTHALDELFPLKLDKFKVVDGEVHYREFHRSPDIDLVLTDVQIDGTNFTNSERLSKSLVARVHARARPTAGGTLEVKLNIDPNAHQPTFDLDLALRDVELVRLNDAIRAYALVDAEEGKFTLVSELAASKGRYSGYVKPLFDHVRVLSIKEDIKNPLKLVWETTVELMTRLLRNQKHDRIATKIPISGSFDDPKVDVWATIAGIFRNAFIAGLNGKIEGSVDLKSAEKPKR